ncbi:MAG: LamG domain-containing protein, partial [Chlamydiia bacterium]|nr:LamG domain-containing protein [Chlamydiia bacterium]
MDVKSEFRFGTIKQHRLVSHRGQLILFEWRKQERSARIFDLFYRIVSQQTSLAGTKDRITDWQLAPFPWVIRDPRQKEVPRIRIVGLSALQGIDSLSEDINSFNKELAEKYAIVSDTDACHVFRFSERGTILYNRFQLDEEALTNENATFKLLPHLDVRFRRSGEPGMPIDEKNDALDTKAVDGKLFYEPSYEIAFPFFGGTYQIGDFTVVQAPTNNSDIFRWFLISYGIDQKTLSVHTLLKTRASPLEVEAVEPAIQFDLFEKFPDLPRGCQIKGHPSAAFYYQSKDVQVVESQEIGAHHFKGDGHVMVSLVIGNDKFSKLCLIDFPLDQEGKTSMSCFEKNALLKVSQHLSLFEIHLECVEAKLLASADGFLHCYYIKTKEIAHGDANVYTHDELGPRKPLGVYLFDTKIKNPKWTLKSGGLRLIGKSCGEAFDRFTPILAPNVQSGFFDLTLDYAGLFPKESWRGLPQLEQKACDVINGKASDDLDDPHVLSGNKTFYDYHQKFSLHSLKLDEDSQAFVVIPRNDKAKMEKIITTQDQITLVMKVNAIEITASFALPKTAEQLHEIFRGITPAQISFSASLNVLKVPQLPLWMIAPAGITKVSYKKQTNVLELSDGTTLIVDKQQDKPFTQRLNAKLELQGIVVLSWLESDLDFVCQPVSDEQEKISFFHLLFTTSLDKQKGLKRDMASSSVVEQGLLIEEKPLHQQRTAMGVFATSHKSTNKVDPAQDLFESHLGQRGKWIESLGQESLQFEGSEVKLEVNRHDLKLKDRWTAEMWLKPSSENHEKVQTLFNYIPGKEDSGFHAFRDGYQILLRSGPSLSFEPVADDKRPTFLQSKGLLACDLAQHEECCWDFWVRLDRQSGTVDQVILETRDPRRIDSNLFQLGVEPNGRVFFVYQPANQPRQKLYFPSRRVENEVLATAQVELPLDGQWHHLTLVCRAKSVGLFIDGILQQGVLQTGLSRVVNLKPHETFLFIGSSTFQKGSKTFCGSMSNLRFWNYAPVDEVQQLMRNMVRHGLIAAWSLTERVIKYTDFPKPFYRATVLSGTETVNDSSWDLALETGSQAYKLKDYQHRSPLQSLI